MRKTSASSNSTIYRFVSIHPSRSLRERPPPGTRIDPAPKLKVFRRESLTTSSLWLCAWFPNVMTIALMFPDQFLFLFIGHVPCLPLRGVRTLSGNAKVTGFPGASPVVLRSNLGKPLLSVWKVCKCLTGHARLPDISGTVTKVHRASTPWTLGLSYQ